jgi:hypothetical protein
MKGGSVPRPIELRALIIFFTYTHLLICGNTGCSRALHFRYTVTKRGIRDAV